MGKPKGYSPTTNQLLRYLNKSPGIWRSVKEIGQAVYGDYNHRIHRRVIVLVSLHNRTDPSQQILGHYSRQFQGYAVAKGDKVPPELKTRREQFVEILQQNPKKITPLPVIAKVMYGQDNMDTTQKIRSIANHYREDNIQPPIQVHMYRNLVFGYSFKEKSNAGSTEIHRSGADKGETGERSSGEENPDWNATRNSNRRLNDSSEMVQGTR